MKAYTSNSTSFQIDKNNSIDFNTRRNNEKSATEFYNLIYTAIKMIVWLRQSNLIKSFIKIQT